MRAPLVLALTFAAALAACEKKPAPSAAPPDDAPHAVASAEPAAPLDAGRTEIVRVPAVLIAERGPTRVHVAWTLPPGTGVNEGGPFRVAWTSSEGLVRAPDEMHAKGADVAKGFDVLVEPNPGVPSATLAGDVSVVVCDTATHRVCVPVKRRIAMEFYAEGKEAKDSAATASVPLPAAR